MGSAFCSEAKYEVGLLGSVAQHQGHFVDHVCKLIFSFCIEGTVFLESDLNQLQSCQKITQTILRDDLLVRVQDIY
jgi:hypothetical protein